MRRLSILLMVFVFLFNTSESAQAELCSMVGCSQVGYVFLPTNGPAGSFYLGSTRCQPPVGTTTFTSGLPNINAIARLQVDGKPLWSEAEIESDIDKFQPPYVDVSKGPSNCKAEWYEPKGGSILSKGMKLRILGYRTFVGHHTTTWPATAQIPHPETRTFPQQLLFAMVVIAQ